jgi:ribonuclease VapC
VSSVVLDASAVLALFLKEAGAEIVAQHTQGAIMSAVNVEEVAARMLQRGDKLEDIAADLQSLSVEFVPFHREQAFLTASLKAVCQGLNISLADRVCLALGMERGLPILTSDGKWEKLGLDVTLRLIR